MKNQLGSIKNIEEKIATGVTTKRQTYADKYPLVFALGATFGLVSVLYGFEKIIDKIPLFENNPWILLVTGVTVLIVTGSLYKKLN